MSGNPYHVKLGLWTNHSNGVWTLTLGSYWGAVLAAALVIYVGIIGTLFWMPVKFFLHQMLVRQRARSAFSIQFLVMLRNSASPIGFAWHATKLNWRWRKKLKAYVVVCLVAIALAVYAGWTAARVLVVKIHTTAGNQILLAPQFCGIIEYDPDSTTDVALYGLYSLNQTLVAQSRVDQCSSTGADASLCGLFPKPSLNWTGRDTTCFLAEENICISTNSTPYLLDTGFLHSSHDLGINQKHENAILIRRATSCSPVHSTGFVAIQNINQTRYAANYPLNDRMQLFFYGPFNNGFDSFFGETYFYSENTPLFPFSYDVVPYSSDDKWAPNTTFFNRDDATASLFFFTANHVTYTSPVYDPVFSATNEYTVPYNQQQNQTLYAPTFLVNTMACIDQYQVCNTNATGTSGCTPSTTNQLLVSAASQPELHLNTKQIYTVERLANALVDGNLAYTLTERGGSGLLASRSLRESLQIGLPKDQWRNEAANMLSVQLARLQQQVIDYAAGPRSLLLNDHIVLAGSGIPDDQCHNQRISLTNSGFDGFNFNFTAILIALCVGSVVGGLSLGMDRLIGRIQRSTGNWRLYQRTAWRRDDLQQVLKDALSRSGLAWEHDNDEDEDIPLSTQTAFHDRPPPLSTTLPRTGTGDGDTERWLNVPQGSNAYAASASTSNARTYSHLGTSQGSKTSGLGRFGGFYEPVSLHDVEMHSRQPSPDLPTRESGDLS